MKVHVRHLGCRLNQSEIETMARQFIALGHEMTDDPSAADQIVVNTCAVTLDATRDSRKLIRSLHRASPDAQIAVTGCYAQIAPHEISVLPGVQTVIGNLEKDRLVPTITGQALDLFEIEPIQRGEPPWVGRTRAFIKVQDGCDNACTFCVTTIARGQGRSRSLDDVIREIRLMLAASYQEIVLTGVHLGSYGQDLGLQDGLRRLVEAILARTDVQRVRLSSLEPWDLTPDFFSLWADRRLCPHLHLPLQSGCDATLRRMARRTTQKQFAALIDAARAQIDQPCITSDIIVGFPGETDEEFDESLRFVQQMSFAGLHVFRYSARPGTAAARMRYQVSETVKRERSVRMIAVGESGERAYALTQRGSVRPVLWEQIAGSSADGFINMGYTDNYVRVSAVHPRPLTNLIMPARLLDYDKERHGMRVEPLMEG
ncbi:MAG: tRNA (N(6)-L-threonylcarbamoyladenosine(37)-C(2))-methylthiotransferase MtaB [Phototrophicales bacterium]|nr:MAG: tRNA (N(6)-L-threonylcarbamoyladenosine(37)-C(2))-methylthiotransferase MtaB [Phototrophicales bacterium]